MKSDKAPSPALKKTAMIRVENAEDINDSRLSCWNELLGHSACPLPFQRREWVKSWLDKLKRPEDKTFILLAYQQDTLVGIAPLLYKKNSWPGHCTIEFIGSGYFDYFDFIINKGLEKDVILGFLRKISGAFSDFELGLKNIFRDSPSFAVLSDLIRDGELRGFYFKEDVVPYIELPQSSSELHKNIKKSLKTDIARQLKRLEELGGLEYKQCASPDEASQTLEDFFFLHIKKWESSRGYSAYKFLPRRAFMRELLRALFEERIVNLHYLLFEKNRKIAVCFTFELCKKMIYYAPAYDPEFYKYSPGKILISKLLDLSAARQFREFDFGIGAESYKLEWPSKIRELDNVYLYEENNNLGRFWMLRRRIANIYFYHILPVMRKVSVAVYIWRWFNRKKGSYKRFQ